LDKYPLFLGSTTEPPPRIEDVHLFVGSATEPQALPPQEEEYPLFV